MIFNKKETRKLFREMREKSVEKYDEAINLCQPGFFGGNNILFVAQNPATPKPDKNPTDKILMNKNTTDEEFHEAYKRSQLNWKFYEFIQEIIGDSMDFSIINAVPYPTIYNQTPSCELIEECSENFKKSIELIDPKIIVCLSFVARFQIKELNIDKKYKIVYTKHYAYWMRRSRVEYLEELKRIKKELKRER